MKKFFILLFCCFTCVTATAKWRTQYIPADNIKGTSAQYCYIFDLGDRAITITEEGFLMISFRNKTFLVNDSDFTPVVVEIYYEGKLLQRDKFFFLRTDNKHSAGDYGYKPCLRNMKQGAVIRIIAPLTDGTLFDVMTTKLYG